MNFTTSIALLALVCATVAQADSKPSPTTLADRIQPICDEYGAELSGSVLVKNGDDEHACYFGVVSDETGRTPSETTRFLIASNGKHMVATAILRLYEMKLLQLDEPVAPLLGVENPAWQAVTVHHLLTHTSGIPSAYDQDEILAKLFVEEISIQEMINAVKDLPLGFEPGSEWDYSNTGYDFLGEIVRQRTGMTLGQFMDREIFARAGLRATTVSIPTDPDAEVARTYHIDEDGRHDILSQLPVRHVDDHFAAGNIYSTAADMMTWLGALTSGRVLSSDTYDLMTTPVLNDYGYGIFSFADSDGRHALNHGGSWVGYVNQIHYYPEEQAGFVYWHNQTIPEDRERAFVRAIRNAVFPE